MPFCAAAREMETDAEDRSWAFRPSTQPPRSCSTSQGYYVQDPLHLLHPSVSPCDDSRQILHSPVSMHHVMSYTMSSHIMSTASLPAGLVQSILFNVLPPSCHTSLSPVDPSLFSVGISLLQHRLPLLLFHCGSLSMAYQQSCICCCRHLSSYHFHPLFIDQTSRSFSPPRWDVCSVTIFFIFFIAYSGFSPPKKGAVSFFVFCFRHNILLSGLFYLSNHNFYSWCLGSNVEGLLGWAAPLSQRQ